MQTVDFFTPVVDDPYWFGAIAAANALSDVYAMGGRPLTALNIAGFPVGALSLDVLAEILRGGSDKMQEAGVTIVGGHTVDDTEPKYGLAVTGLIHPDHIISNAAGRAGDVLVLTKPLGSGIGTTAIKRGLASEALSATIISMMATLNRNASEAMQEVGARCATDITGFGLLGHLAEMASGSGLSATLSASSVPVVPGVLALAEQDVVPSGSHRNLEGLAERLQWDPLVSDAMQLVLADAQTSGGLLIAIAPESVDSLLEGLERRGGSGAVIGNLGAGTPGTITVLV